MITTYVVARLHPPRPGPPTSLQSRFIRNQVILYTVRKQEMMGVSSVFLRSRAKARCRRSLQVDSQCQNSHKADCILPRTMVCRHQSQLNTTTNACVSSSHNCAAVDRTVHYSRISLYTCLTQLFYTQDVMSHESMCARTSKAQMGSVHIQIILSVHKSKIL